ncbi:MAG: glycoside hydrolase family 3 C-terminal domain-containing protein [Acetobacter sp.]|nr:glycoside hydrolase family 3 C-terminal domain-containing protein [Bacteroides sp.]MCM1341108.1 glycoside hydrolase family 3 C-terminal domain-containing protein [Acetobacter sp.]MCM1433558.1 glycoside hydrolase family 3 C-terminal domain-containing protein [Clostridiales bacterium]
MKHPEIVKKMTLEQKAAFVSGYDYWHLEEAAELGLPKIMITDGPHGLRKQKGKDYVEPEGAAKTSGGIGLGNSVPTTCFPPAATSSCSWDMDLLQKEGEAMGQECLKEKVSTILGPGTNIKRSPVCGRNFEYFSEDPLLAGKCSAAVINGVQSKGVGTSLKHFACNSQEAFRMVLNEVIDERTMREIYLPAFEIAVKESQPWTIMNSYNRINGVYASQNEWLQEQVLRKEWGFDGLLVTDWGASVDRIPGLKAGTDLEMPSSGDLNTKRIIEAVKNGDLDEAVLDARVDNVVNLIVKSKPALEKEHTFDPQAHHKIAQEIAEGSMVLLKNDDAVLPLKDGQKVAVIGEMAKAPRFQGAGSSVINPTMLSNAYDELEKLGVDMTYAQGYYKSAPTKKEKKTRKPEAELVKEAVAAAKACDVAVVFVGLTEEFEGEGYDREAINMPENHNALVSAVAAANPNTVVVLAGGSVVLMPWLSEVKGLLNSGLGGQASGGAVANILTGKVNPSGKTSETYPVSFSDNPTYDNYPGGPVTSEHKESVYIGYRYYDAANLDVVFPFGYGLSYTTFEYSDIKLSADNIKDTDTVTVSFKIKNTGNVDGAEVAEIYVADKESTIYRPVKELRAFKKVFIKAGEEAEVSVELSKRAFAFYNVDLGDWQVETGEFDIMVGASSRDIKLTATMTVESTVDAVIPDYRKTAPNYYNDVANITRDDFAAVYGELPSPEIDTNKKIDIYCCLNDARHTKWGGRLCGLIEKIMSGMGSDANGDGKMLAAMATQIPVRNFIAMSMGAFSPAQAEGLLMMLNDDQSSFAGFSKIFWRLGGTIAKLPKLLSSI